MKTATIEFKTKVKTMYNVDDTVAYRYVNVPVFTTSHCDMSAFRQHPKYGGYANSSLFASMLARIRKEIVGDYDSKLRLDRVPENVKVDFSGFLVVVTVTV